MLREQQVGGGCQSTDATPSRTMAERAVAAGGGVDHLSTAPKDVATGYAGPARLRMVPG